MKKILVVDESQAVRETVALILRRDFAVDQRAPVADQGIPTSQEEGIDLFILGAAPGLGSGSPALLRIASQIPCPVLFLVDSRSLAEAQPEIGKIDYLAKPFNPYTLKDKVGRLLAQAASSLTALPRPFVDPGHLTRYVDVPYLPASTSALAKRFALTSLPILIQGETGSGQEKVARALHALNGEARSWLAAYPPEITNGSLLRRMRDLLPSKAENLPRVTLFLSGLESLQHAAQCSLLNFFDEVGEMRDQIWILSSSQVDLLEKVYRGEFLDALYYRLATLTLRLPPLRERQSDLPSLAARLAEEFGQRLGLGKVSLSSEVASRLSNYLWFGNLGELETVIARTLAIHKKDVIEASDLILGEEGGIESAPAPTTQREVSSEGVSSSTDAEPKTVSSSSRPQATGAPRLSKSGNGDYRDIRVLINELAHELKNPMVTIKTFTQLLGDRYDDETFRGRFQETVGSDIERMDELVETLLDFSRFTQPSCERVFLYEQLRRVLEDVLPECMQREATIRWGRKEESSEVFADKAQLHYALINVLRTVLAEVKPRGEIQIDVEGEGRFAIAYLREGGQTSTLAHYLELSAANMGGEDLPLRVLLAKILMERVGGGLAVNQLEGGKVLIRAELPVG